MPWQRLVADVATEVDPETGRLYYSEVVVLVPRQSGKTSLGLSVRAERALGFGERQKLIYTAQTHGDARRKLFDDHWPMLTASALAPLVTKRAMAGSEALCWANGSIDAIAAPTEKAGHGMSLDLGFVDEAFSHTDDRLEQAFNPAMITRPEPQLWIVSTAGTDKSTWLKSKVDAGRTRLAEDPDNERDHRTAYFEWSAGLDDDPVDPATWWSCMPALGYTITEKGIRSVLTRMLDEHGMDGLGLFRRAYLNQWPDAYTLKWVVIPQLVWERCGGAQDEQRPIGEIAIGVDAAWPDGEWCSISVATRTAEDDVYIQLLDRRAGTTWAVPVVKELMLRHPDAILVIDSKGPAGQLIGPLDRAGVEVHKPALEDLAHASSQVKEGISNRTVRHYDQPDMNAAVANVTRRPLADAWTWARKNEVDVSPFTSATLAVLGLEQTEGLMPWAMAI